MGEVDESLVLSAAEKGKWMAASTGNKGPLCGFRFWEPKIPMTGWRPEMKRCHVRGLLAGAERDSGEGMWMWVLSAENDRKSGKIGVVGAGEKEEGLGSRGPLPTAVWKKKKWKNPPWCVAGDDKK